MSDHRYVEVTLAADAPKRLRDRLLDLMTARGLYVNTERNGLVVDAEDINHGWRGLTGEGSGKRLANALQAAGIGYDARTGPGDDAGYVSWWRPGMAYERTATTLNGEVAMTGADMGALRERFPDDADLWRAIRERLAGPPPLA